MKEVHCSRCGGVRMVTCPHCHGKFRHDAMDPQKIIVCDRCKGGGQVLCDRCRGTGKEPQAAQQ